MYDKIKPNLLAILDAAYKIQSYTQVLENATQFYADTKTFDAVLMNFVVMGEAANKLPMNLYMPTTIYPGAALQGSGILLHTIILVLMPMRCGKLYRINYLS